MRYIILLALLAGCTTDQTILKNEDTGQISRCGGNTSVGIFYFLAEHSDANCVKEYKNQGFVEVK